MKKLLFAVIALLLIIGFGIYEQKFVKSSLNELQDRISIVESYIDNNDLDNAEEEVKKVQNWWYKRRDILEFLCPNNEIKDIAKEIGELQGSIKAESDSDPKTRCIILKEMAKNSNNLLAFKWKNVL